MSETQVTIDPRFCGPPDSGNGGVAAGLLADAIDGPAQVTLCAPPPLGVPMALSSDGREATLHCGEHLIATGQAHALTPDLLTAPPGPRPSYDDALATRPGYAGFSQHLFPGCFVCGPDRSEDDGLRIFAAPCGAGVAAAWQPGAALAGDDGAIDTRYLYAALDCPTFFAFCDPDLGALLGRMHVAIFARPRPNERLVIEAWPVARDGRKHRSAAVLRRDDGEILAGAMNTWIQVSGPIPGPPVPSAL